MTLEFNAPVVTRGFFLGEVGGFVYAEVGADKDRITFNKDEFSLYDANSNGYYANIRVYFDVCDSSTNWSEIFDKISYTDDQNNNIDLSAMEEPSHVATGLSDDGVCSEYTSVRRAK